MCFLTRLILITIALTVSALPGNSQEGKPKQGSSAVVESPPPPAVEYNPNSWKEFSDARGMFSIMLPGIPVEADNSSNTVVGRKFTLTTSAIYLVAYLDFPTTFPYDLEKEVTVRKQLLDATSVQLSERSNARVLNETDITFDGHPGRLLKLALPNGGIIRQKQYVVGKRLYQILVITPKELLAPDGGRFDESRATRFLDSFKLAACSCIESQPDAWKVYSSAAGRFAIMFPGTPAVEDNSYDTAFGRCDARDYILNASAEYRVSYTDFVVDLEQDAEERNKTFDYIRDRTVADVKVKVSDETLISLDGHPGRMMKLAAPDGSITRSRSYVVGKRLYQIMVTTSKASQAPDGGWFQESWATKFFDSFKLAQPE